MSDPNPNPPTADAKPAEKAAKAKKARVLVDCEIGGEKFKANDVGTFDEAVIKAQATELDAEPAAVKYAESLKKAAPDAEA